MLTLEFIKKFKRARKKSVKKQIVIVCTAFSFLAICWFLFIPNSVKGSLAYDPLTLLAQIKKTDQSFTLIDLRSQGEYKKGHILGAVNLVWQGDLGAWFPKFKQLKLKKQPLILYQHSQASVAPQTLTTVLRRQGIKAYYLSIGWNEWRHFHTFWLPESEWSNWRPEQFIEPVRE